MPEKRKRSNELQFDQEGEGVVQQQLNEAYHSGVVDNFITQSNVFTGEPVEDEDAEK